MDETQANEALHALDDDIADRIAKCVGGFFLDQAMSDWPAADRPEIKAMATCMMMGFEVAIHYAMEAQPSFVVAMAVSLNKSIGTGDGAHALSHALRDALREVYRDLAIDSKFREGVAILEAIESPTEERSN